MANTVTKPPKPHAIMFPFPLQGHVIPFTHLATKLASNGFTITFVNTQYIHHQIFKAKHHHHHDNNNNDSNHVDFFSEARKSGLDIRYETVSDGLPLGFDRSLNHDQFLEGLLHVFSAYVDELVGKLVRLDPGINCLISDTFYVWPANICKKYGLVNISFFTQPAMVFSVYYHAGLLKENGHFATQDNRKDDIDYIPGIKSLMPTDLVSYFQVTDDISTPPHRIVDKSFKEARKSDLILCNTVQEFEPETISVLQQKHPFYAIGPIFPPRFTKSSISTSLWAESDCTHWLNTMPNGSVLYVSFGSYAHASKKVIEEIANGLLMSGVYFVWVLRPDIVSADDNEFLPVGFEEKIKGQGLVVSWCCQIEVLSHSAIGGFLTHCGWNSIVESIKCGVPLLCYPLLTDQFTNRKLVVDDMGIGINLCDDLGLVTREEVAEKICRLMRGKASEIRERVKKARKMLEGASEVDGSSHRNFHQFIVDLKAQIAKNKGFANAFVVKKNGHCKSPN